MPSRTTPHHPLAFSSDASEPIVHLGPADNVEVREALQRWKDAEHGDAQSVSRETFPLPNLGPRLREITRTLYTGQGFTVLRGLELAKTPEDNMIIYLGISSYVGSQRGAQNKKRDMISHITDSKDWSKVPVDKRHGIHTNTALPFHNDMGAEILTLQYRQLAKVGGATSVASATTILQELSATHPDVVRTLQAPTWPVQLSAHPVRFATLPLVAAQPDGRFLISVDPGRLGLHPATADVRSKAEQQQEQSAASHRPCELDAAQLHALAVLNQTAEKHAISIAAQTGDILFLNNWALLHKRDKYIDFDDATARRHLVRLWLREEEEEQGSESKGCAAPPAAAGGWTLPESMQAPWKAAYGAREGFARFLEDRYEVVPVKEYKVPKYSAGSAAWLIECDEEDAAAAGAPAV